MLKDISKETSVVKTISFIKESTRISPKSSCEDIDTLNYKEMSGSLVINREYQRNYIQTAETASAYIESIFLGLIIPEIQVFEDYNTGEREIIDGQQRVLSLLKFYRGEYKLTKLKEFPELNGLYFNDLPQELKNIIKNFQVNVRTFTNSDELYKYIIFERLNTGAKKLNSQEVRNCVYRGKMIDLAKSLSNVDEVVELFIGVKNNRFERVEVILNIISLMYFFSNNEYSELLHDDVMKRRINKFLELAKTFDEDELKRVEDKFKTLTYFISSNFNILNIINVMYPEIPNFTVPRTICESLYLGFESYDLSECEKHIDELRTALYNVFTSREYKDCLGISTLKSCKLTTIRNNMVKDAINSVLNK